MIFKQKYIYPLFGNEPCGTKFINSVVNTTLVIVNSMMTQIDFTCSAQIIFAFTSHAYTFSRLVTLAHKTIPTIGKYHLYTNMNWKLKVTRSLGSIIELTLNTQKFYKDLILINSINNVKISYI